MRLIPVVLLMALALAATGVLMRAHGAYAAQDRDHIGSGASAAHWTGTDELGRDRATRVAAALLLGLAGATACAALTSGLAVTMGVTAAFVPPSVARAMMYAADLFLTLPWLFLLMMVRSALPLTMAPLQSAAVTFLLLALLGWPVYARTAYAGARGIRNSEWLLHGRAAGLRTGQLARRHVLPHLLPLLLSQFLISIPAALVAEANLGTMGLGISEPLPSWGSMLLALGSQSALANSRWVYLPIALLVTVLLLFELLTVEV